MDEFTKVAEGLTERQITSQKELNGQLTNVFFGDTIVMVFSDGTFGVIEVQSNTNYHPAEFMFLADRGRFNMADCHSAGLIDDETWRLCSSCIQAYQQAKANGQL